MMLRYLSLSSFMQHALMLSFFSAMFYSQYSCGGSVTSAVSQSQLLAANGPRHAAEACKRARGSV